MIIRVTVDLFVDDSLGAELEDVVDEFTEALRNAAIDHELRAVEDDPEGDGD